MNIEKHIAYQDTDGKVVRVIKWDGQDAKVIRRFDTKRLEVLNNLDFLLENGIDFEELASVSGDNFTVSGSKQAVAKNQALELGKYGQLKLVTDINSNYKNEVNDQSDKQQKKLLLLTLLLMLLFTFIGGYLIKSAPEMTPKIEQELKQEVVKIVKNIQKATPVKVQQAKIEKQVDNQTKVSPSKVAGLKRMGALSVLGSLNSGKNKGGLDINAAQTSAGPGMGGGTQGSGGIQTSLYAKGITSAALGAGNNVNGGGGYGTKGKGGGQAGYGKLSLTGSSGATPMPLSAEANVAAGLDRDQIAAVINRNIGQVTYCYEQGLSQDSSLNGRVAISFVIGGTGLVKTAKVSSSTLNSKSVEDCIVMRLKTWKFPVPEGGVDVDVTYPFKLSRAGQG